jgi:hypothetical protein
MANVYRRGTIHSRKRGFTAPFSGKLWHVTANSIDTGAASGPALVETLNKVARLNVAKPASTAVAAAPRELGGREGPEPTRFGDWELRGRCIDF